MVIRQTLSLQMDDIGYVVALQCSSAAHAHHTLTKIYILAENRHVVLSQCAVILQISLIFFFSFFAIKSPRVFGEWWTTFDTRHANHSSEDKRDKFINLLDGCKEKRRYTRNAVLSNYPKAYSRQRKEEEKNCIHHK